MSTRPRTKLAGRHANRPLERIAERTLRRVPELRGKRTDPGIGVAKRALRQHHSPRTQIRQRRNTRHGGTTSPLLDDIGGVYLQNNDVAPLDERPIEVNPDIAGDAPEMTVSVAPYAVDPESAQRLWALSERLVSTR